MRLFIEPTETLIFRTGRPFDAGQNTFAESLFPPTPETIQGAVRALIASYWHPQKNTSDAFDDPQLTSRIGDRSGYGRFRLTGIALGRYHKADIDKIDRLFPPPAHIVSIGQQPHPPSEDTKCTNTYKTPFRLLPHPIDTKKVWSNMPSDIQFTLKGQQPSDESLTSIEGWLTEKDLNTTLGRGDLSDIQIICKEDIYQEEPRLGIARERRSATTKEGYLYHMLMIRMNPHRNHDYIYGFVVDVDLTPLPTEDSPLSDEQIQHELKLPSAGWMTMGGEQRPAHFRVVPSQPRISNTWKRERTLLYLSTPATFETGWKPSPNFAPLDMPITAAINRYEAIGGWRLNSEGGSGENKEMRRYVPAGSVYFFDTNVTSPQALTDSGKEIGYGITFEGEW